MFKQLDWFGFYKNIDLTIQIRKPNYDLTAKMPISDIIDKYHYTANDTVSNTRISFEAGDIDSIQKTEDDLGVCLKEIMYWSNFFYR